MGNRHSLAPYPASVAHAVENLGQPKLDSYDHVIGYERSHFCLGHLEYLLFRLKQGDTAVMAKLRNLSIGENHLIPIILFDGDDRSIVMATVNLMSMVTKPLEKKSSKYDRARVVLIREAMPTILRHFDDTLQLVKGKYQTEEDWSFVQSVLLLFRNVIIMGGITCNIVFEKIPDVIALDDNFLGKIFADNLMNEVLVITNYIDHCYRVNSVEVEVSTSTFFRVVRYAAAFKGDGNSGPVLPLSKETVKAVLVPFSVAAIVAIGTLNATAAKPDGLAPSPSNNFVGYCRVLLSAMPYSYVPVGLFGIILSVGASVNGGLTGFASGFMLIQFLHIIFVGALTAFVKTRVSEWIVGTVAALLMLVLIICWGTIFKYPEWLSSLLHEPVMGAFRFSTTTWRRVHGSPRAAGTRVTPAKEIDLESIRTGREVAEWLRSKGI